MPYETLSKYLTERYWDKEIVNLNLVDLPEGICQLLDGDTDISRSWSGKINTANHTVTFLNKVYHSAKEILKLYDKYGSADYIGEAVTQKEHGLQCARCAQSDIRLQKYSSEKVGQFIVAAFLHDIGHLIGLEKKDTEMMNTNGESLGIQGHEKIGAEYLQKMDMPKLVCDLVGSHVKAKRYLCSKDSTYHSQLSAASAATMVLQGGLMTTEELQEFESDPIFEMALILRDYDDNGKNLNVYNTITDEDLFSLIISSCIT